MKNRLRFLLNRLSERLWIRPLIMCVLAIGGAFLAKGADYTNLGEVVPEIAPGSINTLLTVMSGSMLVIATFAVSSMVSAYASASSNATPRSLMLIIADDVSQNALSAFIGAFIFSIISLIVVENSYYNEAGRFTLFVLTLLVFAIVIVTFVGWVDSVARLGRLGSTIDKVEAATAAALIHRKSSATLGGVPVTARPAGAKPVFGNSVGYVRRVDCSVLQKFAEKQGALVEVAALPGAFSAPGQPLAFVITDSGGPADLDTEQIIKAFTVGDDRSFDEDPRFGLIVLSEIAGRALSPGINDPGTAIDVIGTLVRLFTSWTEVSPGKRPVEFDRVSVPELSLADMFDDAFLAIARDGAGSIEVVVRLQKAFKSLASIENSSMRDAAREHAKSALARAEMALEFAEDIARARESASFITSLQ